MYTQWVTLGQLPHTPGEVGPQPASFRPSWRIPGEPRWEDPREPEGTGQSGSSAKPRAGAPEAGVLGGCGTVRWWQWPCLESKRVAPGGDPLPPCLGATVSPDAVSCDLLVSRQGCSYGGRAGGTGSVCALFFCDLGGQVASWGSSSSTPQFLGCSARPLSQLARTPSLGSGKGWAAQRGRKGRWAQSQRLGSKPALSCLYLWPWKGSGDNKMLGFQGD